MEMTVKTFHWKELWKNYRSEKTQWRKKNNWNWKKSPGRVEYSENRSEFTVRLGPTSQSLRFSIWSLSTFPTIHDSILKLFDDWGNSSLGSVLILTHKFRPLYESWQSTFGLIFFMKMVASDWLIESYCWFSSNFFSELIWDSNLPLAVGQSKTDFAPIAAFRAKVPASKKDFETVNFWSCARI